MKKSFLYCLCAAVFLILLNSCSSKNVINVQSQEIFNSGTFRFVAEKANPTNLDVINVLNSLPAGNSARVMDLSSGYYVNFSPDEISASLPYFGRMFVSNFNSTKNGFDFTSKKFSIDTSKSTDKKTVWAIRFDDVPNVQQLFLEVYKSGKAYISINANDRQAISYDGHIAENKNDDLGK